MFCTRTVSSIRLKPASKASRSIDSPLLSYHRTYSVTSRPGGPPKAIVYAKNGQPQEVLECRSIPSFTLPLTPPPGTLNIRFILSPINPADLNVIEGVYPSKPKLLEPAETGLSEGVYVGGNEGLAQVLQVGEGVEGYKEGDWVIMVKQQIGSWIAWRNVRPEDVMVVPRTKQGDGGITEAQAAMMTVRQCGDGFKIR